MLQYSGAWYCQNWLHNLQLPVNLSLFQNVSKNRTLTTEIQAITAATTAWHWEVCTGGKGAPTWPPPLTGETSGRLAGGCAGWNRSRDERGNVLVSCLGIGHVENLVKSQFGIMPHIPCNRGGYIARYNWLYSQEPYNPYIAFCTLLWKLQLLAKVPIFTTVWGPIC